MSIHKYKDWRGWFDAVRSKALQSGMESVSTNLTAFLASNGVAATVPALHDYVLNWHTALVTTGIQFVFRAGAAAAKQMSEKPDPDVIEEDSNPQAFVKPPEQPQQKQP